ncbi:acyl-coenzyme A synthetase/AMP-(fatty) acid ligase [Streptomyces aurantiacus]|uniref:class I adenylate-forming enzyme family protein n=1 Tax=Streptomyces aurantiacus TaxID=47760 RepID=UPI00278F3CE9|nr:class I adenylate-forming enzyme family protein [Streptomyces aurantiacus]MDQ0779974.1 acyl-coenzyme A synthetase/AMP-(fatty) acid ligase [Streptomyces aurantiacus]
MMISEELRRKILDDRALGAGNVLHRLPLHGRSLDEQALWLDGTWRAPSGDHPEVLTLGELHEVVATYAGYYRRKGVRAKDAVAIVTTSITDFALNLLALTSIGAVASLVNANMPQETRREYIRRQRVVGIMTREPWHKELQIHLEDDVAPAFVALQGEITPQDRAHRPETYPFRHAPNDPILISHSSGTTGIPKSAFHTHETLFHGALSRLSDGLDCSTRARLLALPGHHVSAMSNTLLGLLLGAPVIHYTDPSGKAVLDGIEKFRPTIVFGFTHTFMEMAGEDLSDRDLSCVEGFYASGDAAHVVHIKRLLEKGQHQVTGRDLKPRTAPGAIFLDIFGSTEMGYVLFDYVHRAGAPSLGRCIGRPMRFAEAAALSEDGAVLPPGQVGRLGVRSQSLTPGFWNDNVRWHQQWLGGYFLTGDLVYRDGGNNFYHLDRTTDAIRTADEVVYSAYTEELLLGEHEEIRDCTVVGLADEGVKFGWEDEGVAETYMLLNLVEGATAPKDPTAWVNEALTKHGLPAVKGAVIVGEDAIPVGITGKVLKRILRERARTLTAGD